MFGIFALTYSQEATLWVNAVVEVGQQAAAKA